MGRPARLDSLTGLRGIAAWWVVLYHFRSYLAPYIDSEVVRVIAEGQLAVDFFFILSGFVIYLNYHDRVEPHWSSYANYVGARLARIYPLHIATLLFFLLLAGATVARKESWSGLPPAWDWGALAFQLSLTQAWGTPHALTWNFPSWSISAEFFAYLLFPAILHFSAPRDRSWPSLLIQAGVIFATLALYFDARSLHSLGSDIEQNALVRCLLQFWGGCLLCAIFVRRSDWVNRFGWISGFIGLGVATLGIAGDLPDYVFMPTSFWLIILGCISQSSVASRLLSLRFFFWVGEISYSTYLCHIPVRELFKLISVTDQGDASLLSIVVALLAVAITSVILYRLVELPGKTFTLAALRIERKVRE
ncbi:MAG: acyltransferase [Alphaproteobacteria bacterium]|nr:acyltransferase [Alphaproteobacteria bacterium]